MQKHTCRNRKAQFDKVTIRMYCSLLTSSNHWNSHRACYPCHINIIVTINGILGSSTVPEEIRGGSSLTHYQPVNPLFYSLFSCPSADLSATLRWESNVAMQGHAFSICEGRKYRVIHNTPRSCYFPSAEAATNIAKMPPFSQLHASTHMSTHIAYCTWITS